MNVTHGFLLGLSSSAHKNRPIQMTLNQPVWPAEQTI